MIASTYLTAKLIAVPVNELDAVPELNVNAPPVWVCELLLPVLLIEAATNPPLSDPNQIPTPLWGSGNNLCS